MIEYLKNIINDKKKNIGSLCLYLKKRPELIEELNSELNEKLINLTLPQKIWCFLNNSHNVFCNCGELKKWKDSKTGWRETCGNKMCIVEKRKKTNINIYGIDNPMKNNEIKNKTRETNIIKYGFNVPSKNNEIKNKISNVLNNRSDEDKESTKIKKIKNWNNKSFDEKENILIKRKKTNSSKSEKELDDIKNKRKESCLNKYGCEYVVSSNEIRNKINKIFNEKFGGNSPFSSEDIRLKSINKYKKNHINNLNEKLKKFKCEYISHINKNDDCSNIEYTLKCLRTNKIFNISYTNLRIRILSNLEISSFFREEYGTSNMEKKMIDFIDKNYNGEILKNTKDIITPYELDIFLPELKLGFEFNGLYWHSEVQKDKNYHLNKTEMCEKQNIRLIQIYEDDWIYKQNIIKSIIINLLNKTPHKIYARKCEIKEIIDNKLVREFLETNHLQGFIGSKIKIGLFYDNELVSLMTFGDLRKPLGQNSKENIFELLRFCNKLETNVIGGASKLFNYFINKYNPIEIISYADRSWSSGKLYEHIGFELIHKTEPNYYYIIDGIRKHRFNYRKNILVKNGSNKELTEHEIMLKKGHFRIYDSGNLKYIFKKKSVI